MSEHYLTQVIKTVNKTHPHLGNPVAVAMLTIKAQKLLLIVSPRGCGKSRISSFVGLQCPEHSLQDRLSIAGLSTLKDEFSDFRGVVVVDDIAKTQTPYARITTLTTLAELVYSHYCKSHLVGTVYEIENFNGSAIINIQPILLREAVRSAEWEASIQDKSIRYYHLFRPQKPNPLPPDIELEWGFNLDKVETPKLKGKLANLLIELGDIQWGWARVKEHIEGLLMASAALDRRTEVNTTDYRLLLKVLKPLLLESLIMTKKAFETERELASNELAILTEFVTYGQFTLKHLARDYKLSPSQAYRIMNMYSKDWVIVDKNPTTYAPSDELKEKLGRVGL